MRHELAQSQEPNGEGRTVWHLDRALLIGALGLTLGAHVVLLQRQSISWDEFWYLSFVYDHARGTLSAPRQSFHVHFFGWLTQVAGHEVDKILAARTAYLLLLAGTCTCVYFLARRVASVSGALFATLCYAAYSNVFSHGTAFRTDGLSVFLLMTALVLVQSRARRAVALATSAILFGVALLVTIKSAFFLPVFALLLLANPSGERRGAAGEIGLFATLSLATAIGLFFWHQSGVVASSVSASITSLQSTAGEAVLPSDWFPRWIDLRASVDANVVQWTLLGYAGLVLAYRLVMRQQLRETAFLLALILPLLSLPFYRNAFPYFYVFVMPSALVLCGLAFDHMTRNRWVRGPGALVVTVVATLAIVRPVESQFARPARDTAEAQRTLVRAVHDIFPEPVPYIDRNGMMASFPKAGFFMSSWGMERYRDAGRPVFADLLRARGPKFVLANVPALSVALKTPNPANRGRTDLLLDEDARVLRGHFVPYWGPIHVAGTALRLTSGTDVEWDVLVAGAYQLHSEGAVTIGGSIYQPGSTVTLSMGPVSIRSQIDQDVVLRTSSAHGVPAYAPPMGSLFENS